MLEDGVNAVSNQSAGTISMTRIGGVYLEFQILPGAPNLRV
ncbi:hypothetical protein ACFL6S_20730 [Candidatus Poribacteria bacterium]